MNLPPLIAIIPAAGIGSRSGEPGDGPKQYRLLAGEPMLRHAVRALLADARVTEVRVAVAPGDTRVADALAGLPRTVWRFCGGPTRADTVRAALLDAAPDEGTWVLVHDAARPGLPAEALGRLIDACWARGRGGLLALPVADTVKRARRAPQPSPGNALVDRTVSRTGLWLAQTPQLFPAPVLRAALVACQGLADITDEASAVEHWQRQGGRPQGEAPVLVPGARENLKLTWPEDFRWFESWLGSKMDFRVGQGHDVHRLVAGRPLVIGGVRIPWDKGLDGHSDADVLLHAVTDAVLGAAGLGDIGRHFPDTDARWAGADSQVLLATVGRQVAAAGWRVVNVDATVHAQAPKLAPYVDAMAAGIAQALSVTPDAVNVKAKTNEGLGHLGRGEGMAASAVVLLARRGNA